MNALSIAMATWLAWPILLVVVADHWARQRIGIMASAALSSRITAVWLLAPFGAVAGLAVVEAS